jgi:hypothetical protein
VLITPWSAARFAARSGPPLWSDSLFDSSGLADQECTHSHGHCMESQRTHKSAEVGEPFCMGEDPSHHIHYSDKAQQQQQDTNNPRYDFHFAPPYIMNNTNPRIARKTITFPGLSSAATGPEQPSRHGRHTHRAQRHSGLRSCRGSRPPSRTRFRPPRTARRQLYRSTTTWLPHLPSHCIRLALLQSRNMIPNF